MTTNSMNERRGSMNGMASENNEKYGKVLFDARKQSCDSSFLAD